jgi:hypothetical protein
MAGLGPAIHVFRAGKSKTWMPGTRPGMTILLLLARFTGAISTRTLARHPRAEARRRRA